MWQRFSEDARKAVFCSQEEAQRLGRSYVSTEHLLLGLTKDPSTVAARAMELLGLSLERVREETEERAQRAEPTRTSRMTLTPQAKQVIDLACQEARLNGDRHIGTEHLFIGLVREGEDLGAKVLAELGVSLESAREAVLEAKGAAPGKPAARLREMAQQSALKSIEFEPREAKPCEDVWWATFAEDTQRAVWRAWEQAKWEGSSEVGASYLLTALLDDPASELVKALTGAGVDVPALERAAKGSATQGRLPNPNRMTFSDEAHDAIHCACALAQLEHVPAIGPLHLLRGIVESGFAAENLASFGLNEGVLRTLCGSQ